MLRSVKMAYYRKEDWKRFLKSIDDRKSMHETWEEWHEAYSNAKKELILKGFSVKDVIIDIDELKEYCREKGIKNDGNARSMYASSR
jgi:hypothetical protein